MDIKCRHGGIWPFSYWVMHVSQSLSYSCSSAEEGPLISYSPWTELLSLNPASHVTTALFWSQLIHKITRGSVDDRCDLSPAVVSDDLPLDFPALDIWSFVLNELLHSGCWKPPPDTKNWSLLEAHICWFKPSSMKHHWSQEHTWQGWC